MPKNAVQKLQEIQKDINTVISLYEVVNKTKNNNDKPETSKKQTAKQLPQISTPKHLESLPRFDKWEVSDKSQVSLLDTFKKASSFFTRPPQGLSGREPLLWKKWKTNKPGSAPSFSSTLSTAVESDYAQQDLSDAGSASDAGILAKTKTSEELSTSDWLGDNVPPTFNVVMTASKTLETAKEVLEKNNFKENEEFKGTQAVLYWTEKGKEKSFGDETPDRSLDVKRSSAFDVQNQEKSVENHGRNGSIFSRKDSSVLNSIKRSPSTIPQSVVTAKEYNATDKSHLLSGSDTGSTVVVASKEDEKTNQKYGNSGKQGDQPTDNNRPNKDANETTECKMTPSEKKSSILKDFEKPVNDGKVERKKSRSIFNTKLVQFSEIREDFQTNQEAKKLAQPNDETESLASELSKIIEKSNEKLEKMKASKELALNIANHFKEKYEVIQKTKGDLLEKLQIVEKSNERLSSEVHQARESTKMLQEKIQGLEENSIEGTQEVDQLKDLTNEIEYLKVKLYEAERQYNEQLLEKNKKIEEIQTDRLEESKNGLKHQEILAKKLQRLTKEKCELLSKFEELRRQLHDSHCKTKTLEENIRQLEEEVQKQKQHLKIKTETLHETNRELEMIRLNCTDLEDQVKMLRKSIEEFDGIQHSLIRKTTEYEQQIRSNQEKIKDLQDENIRLKGELENQKDGLRIKNKIIEDQQQTIRQLKEKSEDAKTLLKRNKSLERMLDIEREEKLELQEAVQRLKWKKEELKKKIRSLENDFLLAPQEVVRDLQKTQVVLHELENQVQTKQKEWELQLHSLIREKEQACSVAEFATKKLMETTNEFQKQSQAYKGLQRLVAGNLAAKERQHLREGNKKVR